MVGAALEGIDPACPAWPECELSISLSRGSLDWYLHSRDECAGHGARADIMLYSRTG